MLNYYKAYNSIRTKNPKGSYINDFNAIMDATFDNAANIFYDEIEFEYIYGSNVFTKVPKVRVDSITEYNSSMLINGDDFKNFVFMPDFPKPSIGMKFKWNDNYWLVINTNNDESICTTAEVRRCNNVLRYFDSNGNKIYEPCIMDTTLRFTNNQTIGIISTGKEEQKIWCQRNLRTTLIRPNDRFLFGAPNQRYCIRLYAGGIKNELNTKTMDDSSPTLTEFYLEHYQINPETDDLLNGFANAYHNVYTITLNNVLPVYEVGASGTFSATVLKNGITQSEGVKWYSSNNSIISVSESGVFNVLALGDVVIKAQMQNNEDVYTEVDVEVNSTPAEDSYEIVLNPAVNYILQGVRKEFSCYLFKNGIQQANAFQFLNITTNVPSENYKVEVLGNNSFAVSNIKKHMKSPIIIKCVSGDYSKDVSILLKGVY